MQKIDILGTEYEIYERNASEDLKLKECGGYCEQYSKKIVINDFADEKNDTFAVENFEEFQKKVLRHEIIHTFFGESGLRGNSPYAEDEELVDWIAIQFPKLLRAFEQAGAI